MGDRTGMYSEIAETYLNTSEAQNASLLALEPLVDLVRVVPVHVRLLHEGEGHAVVALAERCDVRIVLRLLVPELKGRLDGGRGTRGGYASVMRT